MDSIVSMSIWLSCLNSIFSLFDFQFTGDVLDRAIHL